MTLRDVWLFLLYDVGVCSVCLLLGIAFGLIIGYSAGLQFNPNMENKYTVNIDREIHYCYRGLK